MAVLLAVKHVHSNICNNVELIFGCHSPGGEKCNELTFRTFNFEHVQKSIPTMHHTSPSHGFHGSEPETMMHCTHGSMIHLVSQYSV